MNSKEAMEKWLADVEDIKTLDEDLTIPKYITASIAAAAWKAATKAMLEYAEKIAYSDEEYYHYPLVHLKDLKKFVED